VPVYRYYAVTRTDSNPHAIHAAYRVDWTDDESFAIEWVLETLRGRQYVFDNGALLYSPYLDVTAGGDQMLTCTDDTVCAPTSGAVTTDLHVGFPVWFDYLIVTRDAVVSVDLSKSPDKHWKFTELKGDPRVTGKVHVLLPKDGDVTNVNVGRYTVQRLTDISYPGGRYGSIAMGLAPWAPYGVTSVGYARLDGGQNYVQNLTRLEHEIWHVTSSSPGPTTWRLHGDLVTAGLGTGPMLFVYDMPDPKALRAYLRKR